MNPFEALSKTNPSSLDYDEWGGAFSCQERGCYNTVGVAKYLKKERVLTWICQDGHISKIEDMDE